MSVVFKSVEEAIKELKLDRRHEWYVFMGELIYDFKYTSYCTGCTEYPEMTSPPSRGEGCRECGYKGVRRTAVPVPAIHNGEPVKILTIAS